MRKIFLLVLFLKGISSIGFAQKLDIKTQLEGGLLTYGPATKELGYYIEGVNSVDISGNFSVGLGIGFNKFMLNERDGEYFKALPVFAQAKYLFSTKKKKSFYSSLDLGYSVNLDKKNESVNSLVTYKGGLVISPKIGFLWCLNDRKKENITLSIGYKYQIFKANEYRYFMNWMTTESVSKTKSTILNGYDIFYSNKYHLHRLTIGVGFGF